MDIYNGENINPLFVEKLLSDIKSGNPQYIDLLDIEDCADYLILHQRWDDMDIFIGHCFNIHPDSNEILFIKAKFFIETQRYQEAKDILDFIAPDYVDDAYYYISYGWLFLKQSKQDESMPYFNKAVQLNNDVRYEIAMNFNQLGLYEQVVEYIRPLVEKTPYDSESMFEYAFALNKLGRIKESLMAYENLVDQSPFYPAAWYNLGILYSNNEQYEKAVMAYNTAVTIDPNYSEAYYNLGNTYLDLLQFDKALDCYFEYASMCDPSELDTVMQSIGECWWELGNYDYSRRFYERAVNAFPEQSELWYVLALDYIELGNHSEGLSCLDKAIKIEPNCSQYYFARAQSYCYQEKDDDAYRELMLGIEYEPDAVLAWIEAFKIWITKNKGGDINDFITLHADRFGSSPGLIFIDFIINYTNGTAAGANRAKKLIAEIATVSPSTILVASEDNAIRSVLTTPTISKVLAKFNIHLDQK